VNVLPKSIILFDIPHPPIIEAGLPDFTAKKPNSFVALKEKPPLINCRALSNVIVGVISTWK